MPFSCVSRAYLIALLCGVFGLGGGLFTGKQVQAECGDYVIMMGDSHKEAQPPQQSQPRFTSAEEVDAQIVDAQIVDAQIVDAQIIASHPRLKQATLRLPENTPCRGWNCRAKFPGDTPAAPRHFDGGVKSVGMMASNISQGWESTRKPFRGHDGSALLREGCKNLLERPPQFS
ncbi:MAG: hypothetical protein VX757_04530 [Planctomycetota bacterium]|nr:hypothetical protein [Planctomycetota bacterium]